MRSTRLGLVLAITGTITLLAGCASRGPAPAVGGASATPTPTPTPGTTSSAPTTRPSATSTTPLPWPSGPRTVVHEPIVPPVPVLEHIRYAAHPIGRYDRIVFDFDHRVPGYTIRYVSPVRGDASGQKVVVPGRRFLLVVFTPAQAHDDNGTATVSGTHDIGLPMMRGYAVAGDFEGHVSVAIGLDRVTGYRTGELADRVYVDVAT
jgi:hypothetical protein